MDAPITPLKAGRRPFPPSTGTPPAVALASSTSAPIAASSSTAAPPAATDGAAPSSSSSTAADDQQHPPSDGIINKTLFKCRKCKILFWTTHEAASHEQSCLEPQWYNCSVCQVLRFRSREERTEHERTCPGPMPLRIADLPLADRVGANAPRAAGDGAGTTAATATATTAVTGSAVDQARRASDGRISVVVHNKKAKRVFMKKRIRTIIDTYRDQVRHGTSPVAPPVVSSATAQITSSGFAGNEGSDSSVEIFETSRPKSSFSEGINQQNDVPAEKNADEEREKARNTPSAKAKGPVEWTTVWTCDVCQQEQFDCYEDAVEHEKICLAKKNKEKPSQDPCPASKKGSEATAVKEAGPAAAALASPAKTTPTPSPKESPSPSSKELSTAKNKPLTLFSPILKDGSDSANFWQISKYHRLILKSLKLLHLPPDATSSLGGGGGGGGGGTVSFQCQFCSHPFLPNDVSTITEEGRQLQLNSWTLKKAFEALSSMVLSHVMSGTCRSLPADVGTKLPMAKSSGKMAFNEFLSGFFSENGILERSDGQGVVVLSDEEFQNMPGSERSKRGKQLARSKKKRGRPTGSTKVATSKRQKAPKAGSEQSATKLLSLPPKHREIKYGDMGCKIHNEHGHQFWLGPLDGIPLLSSFSSQEEAFRRLRPSEKLLLQQLELFTIDPKITGLGKGVGSLRPQSVGMRCRNCIADKSGCCFMKLSSVDNMSRDLLLMAKDHVVSCRLMKVKDVKAIQELLNLDRGCSLAKYCNWIVKLYSLVDPKKSGKGGNGNFGGVVWGDSPKLPLGGYCNPADVKVNSILGGGNAPVPGLEAEETPPTPPAKAARDEDVVSEEVTRSTAAEAAAPPSSKKHSSPLDLSKLTHYHYLTLMQFEIVPYRKKLTSSDDDDNRFSDDDDNRANSSCDSTSITAGFKCKHCDKIIGTPANLQQMSILLMDLPPHLECCSLVSPLKKEELAKYKGMLIMTPEDPLDGKHQSYPAGTYCYVRYARELCTEVYGMVDVRDPDSGTSYVGFSDVEELKAKYGKKDAAGIGSSNHDNINDEVDDFFSLPLIKKNIY